ncbi:replication-associated recombination protein A [Paraflavisolibacter sp. H34]|uniref:replication-associated recombination protein A n=1 Tax=Huijunlia imazamoxiresistens TaxID=3127457 RepID=UPI0030184627
MNATPLAERLRPRALDDLTGQQHLTGKGSILRTAIEQGRIPSMILWGPPGTGKTTIAHIIANTLHAPFFTLSAISAGVKEVREVIQQAQRTTGTILFIDEIHRFNKGQQDALLGAVEKGTVTLIGATTENPSFEVNSALLSRCQVYVLKALTEEDMEGLLQKAIRQDAWLRSKNVQLQETKALLTLSGGDGRKLLNLLELVVSILSPGGAEAVPGPSPAPQAGTLFSAPPASPEAPSLEEAGEPVVVTDARVLEIAQQRIAMYDKSGEQHYDIISAFIKSMRGSDPNGAIYWLARMVEGGEDVKFIARRMVIFASEDISNANPNALLLANATFDAVNKIGYPEARIILAQCATYLASSPKSNASYVAIGEALAAVARYGDLPVPLHIRNAPTGLMKKLDYGKNYKYAHDFEGNFTEQEFLPAPLAGTKFYDPGKNAREEELRRYLRNLWKDKYDY